MSEITFEVRGFDELGRALPKVNARAVLAAGAAEYKRLWQAHFAALQSRGNKKGFPSRNFWIQEGARKTEIAELTAEQARVACDSRAVAFQAFGGTVRPASARAIAVPVTAAAYVAGWPSTSGLPLEFVPLKSRKNPHFVGVLKEARATRVGYSQKRGAFSKGENTATAGTTHYLLFDQLTKKGMGEDAVRPQRAEADKAMDAKMQESLNRQLDKDAP